MFVRFLGLLLLACIGLSVPGHAQRVHQVKLVHAGGNLFRFEPNQVNARAGDVLEFVVVSGGPYVVGFEAADLSENDRAQLDQAIAERSGVLRGPVLASPDSRFRIVLPPLAPGSYRFTSLTHISYRMGGILVMK